MASPPFMKLFIADYLADTTHLTRGEHGAYFLLLMATWRAGGKLPADDRKLAKIALCTPKEWAAIKPTLTEFFRRRGGALTHNRVSRELIQYRASVETRKKAGSAGGLKKASNSNNKALAKPLAKPKQNLANQNQNQNQNQTKSSEGKEPSAQTVVIDADGAAWQTAKLLLTERGGLSDDAAGRFFGKLLKENRLEPRDLLSAVASATVSGTLDPRPYLTAAASAVGKRRAEPQLSPSEKALRSNIQ